MEARVCCDTIESEFELIRTLGFLCNCARGLVYKGLYDSHRPQTEYNNQNNSNSFYSLGAVESI